MEQSPDIADLATALAKAQGMVEGAKKDSANPHFKSKYADLESVWAACRDALTSNGLSIVQAPGLTQDGVMHMTTQLSHSSGQWVRQEMSLPLSKVDPQGAGSALTYMRRYALAAFVGVAPEDDDGNAASRPGTAAVVNRRQTPPAEPERGSQRPPALTGPVKTRAEIRTKCGELVRELRACGDGDQLDVVLHDNKALIKQVSEEVQFFWEGDGADFIGLKGEIAAAREACGDNDNIRRQNVMEAG